MEQPLVALLAGLLVLAGVGLLMWPERGLAARWRRIRRLSERVLSEDALKTIYKSNMKGESASLQSVAGALQVDLNTAAAVLAEMQERDLVMLENGGVRLTGQGSSAALHIIRAHRLWEHYLAQETGISEREWHENADRYEHLLSRDETEALSARLGHPTHDPHGDPIPTAAGQIRAHGGKPLPSIEINQRGRIVHIEDEPDAVYDQLVAEGLYPGMEVRLLENSAQRVRFWANGDEHVLAPVVAANISVAPVIQQERTAPESGERLSILKPGERGKVVAIMPRCRGMERRRMMDLGILPGTEIQAELISPSGAPTAYRVRGALIALRNEQADLIQIVRVGSQAGSAS